MDRYLGGSATDWRICLWTDISAKDMSVDRYLGKGHVRGQISWQRTCPWTDISAKDMSVDRYLGGGHVRGQISRRRTCPWTDIVAKDMSVDRYLGGGTSDCCEILQCSAYVSQAGLIPFWGSTTKCLKSEILGLLEVNYLENVKSQHYMSIGA